MALTDGAKHYIAKYLGIVSGSQFCFSDSTATTVKYWDATDVSHMGSTVDAVSTIIMFGGYSYEDKVAETGRIDAAKLTSENGGTALVNDDVVWIANNSDGAAKYCFTEGAAGKGTLYLATDPYCCSAWIDANPDVDPVTIACTKDKNIGEWDAIELDAPGAHTLHIRKTGYDNYYTDVNFIAEGQSLSEFVELTPEAGTDVALLTVNAYKDEEQPSQVPVDNAVVKKGTSKVGFCPYSEQWRATAAGSPYSISIVAEGRETYEEDIILYKDTPKTINAYMAEKRLEIVIKISPGVAFIDDISGGDYQVWYVNSLKEGWVRVETYLDEPTLFKAELTFCTLGTTTPVAGISKIVTEEKLLHSSMSASDRHLDWPAWVVPDAPGEYSLVAELFFMT